MSSKTLKVIGGIVAGLLLGGILTGVLLYRRVSDEPEWYVTPTDPTKIDQAARRAEITLETTSNWASAVMAQEARAARGSTTARTPVEIPSETLTVRLTGEEMTSFLMKWTKINGWDANFEQYLTSPVITVHDGRVVVAGRVKDLDTVLSLHYKPTISPDGQSIRFVLDRVTGGRLPLPASVAQGQLDRLKEPLSKALDRWKEDAKLDARGRANSAMTLTAAGRLMEAVLSGKPAESLGVLPGDRGGVVVRLSGMAVTKDAVEFTAKPIPAAERAEAVKRLRDRG